MDLRNNANSRTRASSDLRTRQAASLEMLRGPNLTPVYQTAQQPHNLQVPGDVQFIPPPPMPPPSIYANSQHGMTIPPPPLRPHPSSARSLVHPSALLPPPPANGPLGNNWPAGWGRQPNYTPAVVSSGQVGMYNPSDYYAYHPNHQNTTQPTQDGHPELSATYIPSAGDSLAPGMGIPAMTPVQANPHAAGNRSQPDMYSVDTDFPNYTTGYTAPPPWATQTPLTAQGGFTELKGQDLTRRGSHRLQAVAQSPSTSTGTLTPDFASQWPTERVLTWLDANMFSDNWTMAFLNLDLHGARFLELGGGHGGGLATVHNTIFPQLKKECTQSATGWDQAREREEGKRLRKLVRKIVEEGNTGNNRQTPVNSKWASSGQWNSSISEHVPEAGIKVVRQEVQATTTPSTAETGEESPGFKMPTALTSPIASSTIAQRRLSNQRNQANVMNALNEGDASGIPQKRQGPEPAMKGIMKSASTQRYSPNGSLKGIQNTGQDLSKSGGSPQLSPAIQQSVRFGLGTGPTSSASSPQRFYHRRARSSESHIPSLGSLALGNGSQPNLEPQELRKNGSEIPRPAGFDASRNPSSETPSSSKGHGFFLKNIIGRGRKKDDGHPSPDEVAHSPSSPSSSMRFSIQSGPSGRHGSAFADVKSGWLPQTAAVPDHDRTPKSPSHNKAIPQKRFIFMTPDSWNYRLVDVSAITDMETFKSVLAYNLGVSESRIVKIHITSPGRLEHNEPTLSDAAMMKLVNNADALGSLKIFVQAPEPTTFSADLGTPVQSNHRFSLVETAKPIDEVTYAKLTSKAQGDAPTSHQLPSLAISKFSKAVDHKVDQAHTSSDAERRTKLEAATDAHRQETERKQKLYLERKIKSKTSSPVDASNTGFRRVQGVIDFDSPRVSPFEDKERNDSLIPLRRPPPVPPDTTTLIKANSLSRKASSARSSVSLRGDGSARSSISSRGDMALTKKLSYEESKADQLDRGRQRSKIEGLSKNGRGSNGKKASRLSSFMATPVSPAVTEAVRPSIQPTNSGQSQRAMAMVNFNESGSRKGSPGGSPRSPGFTMSKGNVPFKIPEYEDDSPGDYIGAVNSVSSEAVPILEPPRRNSKRVFRRASRRSNELTIPNDDQHSISSGGSPNVSPATAHPPRSLHRSSTVRTDPSLDFTERHVAFDKSATSEVMDDDSDDGLFAVPLVSIIGSNAPTKNSGNDDEDDDDDGLFAVPLSRQNKSVSTGSIDISPGGVRDLQKDVHVEPPTPSWTAQDQIRTPASLKRPVIWDRDDSDPLMSDPQSARSIDREAPNTATTTGTVMTWPPETPVDDRRKSFASDLWANRPPPEALVENLDAFFPNVDLDQPMIEGHEETPPSSPNLAAPNSPSTISVQSTPQSANKRMSADRDTFDPNAMTLTRGGIGGVPSMHTLAHNRTVSRATRLARTKSIRDVVKDAYEIGNMNGSKMSRVNTLKSSSIVRRKSTKMFGARIEQIKPPRGSRLIHLETIPQDTLPPTSVPQRQATFKWVKGQLIGKGSFGRVYLGMNTTTGELLAVKQVEINPKHYGHDKDKVKEMVKSLDSEIDTMQHLDHVNIVQYLGCERKEYSISIFLEYISGGSIGSCLRKHGEFEESVVSSLTRQTLAGLAYLHGESILHRDLKADNILLDTDGTCKISDFGISKKSNDIYGNDKTNSMQGSVFWMAPEVIRSEQSGYSAKVDIWSLGCVVLEMFAGRRPWSKEEAVGAIFKLGELNQAPPIPDDVSSSISPAALSFMLDCFSINPDDRPTAETLLRAPFCFTDPHFNFLDTELYDKIRQPY